MHQINEESTFKSTELEIDLKTYNNSIKHYYDNFKDSIDLKSKIPIFLDTNILLRFYSISFKQRDLLRSFFIENKDRIHISGQVQKEFIKNREEVIQKYFQSALETMSENLKTEVINRKTNYLNDNKEILKDFDYINKAIVRQIKAFEKITNKLKEDIDGLRIKNKELNFKDDFLDLLNDFNQSYSINSNELKILKSEFDSLTKNIDKSKLKNDLSKKTNFSIPGIGDILEKPDNPYGDYLIYHEMIKCSIDNDSDILFLTYDTTKGDWMKSNKEPHIHYILRTYQLTNKAIYIIDAERFFEEKLKTHFESLITNDSYLVTMDNETVQDIILESVKLEKVIRDVAEFVCIPETERQPVHRLIYELIDKGIIEKSILGDYRNVMLVKNQLSHRSSDFLLIRYSYEFLEKTLQEIEKLIAYFNNKYSEL